MAEVSITNQDFIYWLNPDFNPNNLPVSPYSVLGLAPVWQGLNLICNQAAKCDLNVNKKSKGGSQPDRSHPAYYLLRRQPNPDMNHLVFKRSLLMNAIIFGNGYAYVRRENANPVELVLLDSQSMKVDKDKISVTYEFTYEEEKYFVRPDSMIHIKGLSYHGIQGLPLVNILKEALQLSQHLLRYKNTFFSNGGKPPYAVMMGQGFKNPDKRKEFQEGLAEQHGTIRNSNKVPVFEGDVSIHEFSQPDMSSLIEMTDNETKAIANILGIPPVFLGVTDEYTSHNSLEQQSKQLLNYTIDNHLTNIEAELELKLLKQVELDNETHCIEFDRSAFEDLDETTRTNCIIARVNNGLESQEEAREELGFNQNKNQTFFRPQQHVRVDENFDPIVPEPPEPANEPMNETPAENKDEPQPEKPAEDKTDTLRSLTVKVINRCVERLKKSVESHAKKGDLSSWDLTTEHRSVLVESLDCFEGSDTLIDSMLADLTTEVSHILPEQANAIDWTKYTNTLTQVI